MRFGGRLVRSKRLRSFRPSSSRQDLAMKAIQSAKGLPPTDGLSAVRNPLLRAGQAAFGLFTVTILSRILPRSRFAI
jgi:hypothetical protein